MKSAWLKCSTTLGVFGAGAVTFCAAYVVEAQEWHSRVTHTDHYWSWLAVVQAIWTGLIAFGILWGLVSTMVRRGGGDAGSAEWVYAQFGRAMVHGADGRTRLYERNGGSVPKALGALVVPVAMLAVDYVCGVRWWTICLSVVALPVWLVSLALLGGARFSR